MASTFFGLNVVYSGLQAQRQAIDVLGYNVAHANDPTYKRQRIVLTENAVLAQSQEAGTIGTAAFGTGTTSGGIERVYSTLVENRQRTATHASAEWAYKNTTLSQVESIMSEPTDSGLEADLDNFWASWQTVANSPESTSVRSTLLEDSAALCERIQYEYAQMSNTIDDLDAAVADTVGQINQIAEHIARLNSEISSMESGQMPVNDLLNERDALVLELSEKVSITQHGTTCQDFVISIGGRVLVQGSQSNEIVAQIEVGGVRSVKWANGGEDVNNSSGELAAMMELRDTIIPSYLEQLDSLASTLTAQVNALHHSGKTLDGSDGGDFFQAGSTAANIALDPTIMDNPEAVAASASGAVGDGQQALAISGLSSTPVVNGRTINEMYQTLVSNIGNDAATASRQAKAQATSLDQFTTQQQAISGVSLDEEMANMIKFQQAYTACAKVLTAMDEMLDIMMRTGA